MSFTFAEAQLPTRRRKSCVSGPVCVETNVGSPTAGLTDSRSIQNNVAAAPALLRLAYVRACAE